eukprot:gene21774-biopygen8681
MAYFAAIVDIRTCKMVESPRSLRSPQLPQMLCIHGVCHGQKRGDRRDSAILHVRISTIAA